MNLYEKKVCKELAKWRQELLKPDSLLERTSKGIEARVMQLVPQKWQDAFTSAIEGMTKSVLWGAAALTFEEDTSGLSLAERDWLITESFARYEKTAILQGAGFGAGGILLGMADFPALLAIKMKYLFRCGQIYGFDVQQPKERLFLLYVFQLAFSAKEHRSTVFAKLENWESSAESPEDMDWEKFQIEYRNYLDVAKMLQLLPVVGSVAGAVANRKLMRRLNRYAMNAYRMRILRKTAGPIRFY